MTNSEPSPIALQGIPCICGLYTFQFEWRKRVARATSGLDSLHRFSKNVRQGPLGRELQNEAKVDSRVSRPEAA